MKLLPFALLTSFAMQAQVKLPPYTREVLPNDVVVMMMPRAGLPLTHIRVLVRGGEESEPSSLAGLSAVTAALLRQGTATRSADQFSLELDSLGGDFNATTDRSATIVTAEFLSKDFDRGLNLVADAVRHPTFPERETNNELARRRDAANAAKDNAQQSIGNYARAAFFGPDHPYGHPADQNTLGRMQRKDIADYYRRIYNAHNLIVIVAGEFDTAKARARIAAEFSSAPDGPAYQWLPAPDLRRKQRLLLIDKPDATQTYFQIIQPGVDRKNPDRGALDLINSLFGGQFTSMLNEELRVNTGLTYGASSHVEATRLPGGITISTYTKTETTVEAIDRALAVLKRLTDGGISADQLAASKAYVKGRFPTSRMETSEQLATILGELEIHNLSRDEIDGYFQRIDAVTPAQATAVARKYYRSDDLLLVLLGNASKIKNLVKKYDPNPRVILAKTPGWGSN